MTQSRPSLFNTVIGPVMRGPSSSHTAASVRIGSLGRQLLGEPVTRATFIFDLNGSLAATYRGQGSAMGLAAGLLQMDMTDPELIHAESLCRNLGMTIEFCIEDYGAKHPNTYRVELQGKSKSTQFTALSLGGGLIRLEKLNGRSIADDFSYISPLMPVKECRSASLPFNDIHDFSAILENETKCLSEYGLEYESALGQVNKQEIMKLAATHLQVMRKSVHTGMKGTVFKDRILPEQAHLISEAEKMGHLIPSQLFNAIIRNVTSVMETKSSMGVIVAAPTAGSCGTLAGTLEAVSEKMGSGEEEMQKGLLAAGTVGLFISQISGFAAEEGGCQYECGSASAMTAAALVDILGGNAQNALDAASMALQNSLGMICDPVADRVEVPCLGKNIMAACNSIISANMALAGFRSVIPFDQTVTAMKEVGDNMEQRYRCTCKGGLSVTPAAKKIHAELANLDTRQDKRKR